MNAIILADNQELTQYGIEHLIKNVTERKITHAIDKTMLIEKLKTNEKAIVIIDYTLFDFSDVNNLLITNERFPNAFWILISEDLTEPFLKSVIYSSTTISIVFKDSPLKEIEEAISYALCGERYICQRVTEIMFSHKKRDEYTPSRLTPTEIEIVRSIAQGKTTKEIASERFSSIHTINTHRKNIFRKLGVNTAHEAIKSVIRAGLIDTSEYYI